MVKGAGSANALRDTVRLSGEICMDEAIRLVPLSSAKVAALTVAGLSGLEKVSTTTVLLPSPVEPSAGVTDVTVGCVVSAICRVVKVVEELAAELPAKSCKPDTETVMRADPARGSAGVKVT